MTKNIIVTGASKGVGFQLARLLVYQGHTVLAFARSEKGLNQLQEDCANLKGKLYILVGDILEPQKLVHGARQYFDKVDVLINNAAAFLSKPFANLQLADLQHVYNINVFAPTLLVKELLPYFSVKSHVVNISSMGGVTGALKFKSLLPYSSSKAALNNITECLSVELAEKEVYCNALALGSVATNMFKKAFPGQKAAATPAQMAKYIANFALNAAPLINGKVISVSNSTP
jgi:NAD(P)-dependent dehydrogenase (short-subunit alcohol dehydrogenase family)